MFIGLLLIAPCSLIPETKGRSLEEMDIIFGAIDADDRAANIARQEQGTCCFTSRICCTIVTVWSQRQGFRNQ